jgi:DNA-directed RNA polymerase specialized sigma subunit
MKDVTLNQREQARLQVLNSVLEYQLPTAQAAEVLGISERQVRRVVAATTWISPAGACWPPSNG